MDMHLASSMDMESTIFINESFEGEQFPSLTLVLEACLQDKAPIHKLFNEFTNKDTIVSSTRKLSLRFVVCTSEYRTSIKAPTNSLSFIKLVYLS